MKSLCLWGFMGTGKSTVGPLAAARLSVPFVDTDEIIAREAGASIPDLWKREGEARFREREREVVEKLLADGTARVVSLGGGALLSRELRHRVLDRAIVVTLTSEPTEIARRVPDIATRPNLAAADPIRRIRELLDVRGDAYAECHASLSTDGVDVDDTADAAVAVLHRDPLVLPLGARTYAIDVVHDSPETLTDAIARIAPSSLVVVTDASVWRARHAALDRALSHLALPRIDVTLPHGEAHKTLSTVSTIWDAALGAGVDRDVLVLAFGGGVRPISRRSQHRRSFAACASSPRPPRSSRWSMPPSAERRASIIPREKTSSARFINRARSSSTLRISRRFRHASSALASLRS